ncbi:MAG: urea ABC transporter permease subunit UrtB, partial [Candidatus Latescibacterota bacterium]
MKPLMYSLLLLFLSFNAQAQDGAFDQQQLSLLRSNDEDNIEAAVKAIGQSGQIAYYDLMKALFGGELYLTEQGQLVVAGNTRKNDYGDTISQLNSAYPQNTPLLDETGKPIEVNLYDLIEVESNRRIRAIIQPYLIQMEIFNPDPIKRRVAAETSGNQGNINAIPTLTQAIEKETNKDIKTFMQVARAKLQLAHTDANVRLEAVTALGELNDTFVLPLLETHAKTETDPAVNTALTASIQWLKEFTVIMMAVQTAFVGLSLGSILILVALGLAVIYGQMGVINMAHGEFMMTGAYTTYVIQNICFALLPAAYIDVFFPISLPHAFVISGSFGLLIERRILRPLYSRPLESLLATWGVSLVLVQLARSIFGDLTAVKLPQWLSGGYALAPQVLLPYNRLFIIVFTLLIVVGLIAFFYKTNFGLRLRAVTQNRNMSACMGVPVRRVDSLTFFIGTGIAGVAGWAMTLIGNVVPNMGQTYIVDGFLVVVVGGVGKIIGTIVAGLGIGISNKVL